MRARGTSLLLAALLVLTVAGTGSAGGAEAPTYTHRFEERFDEPGWHDRVGLRWEPRNTAHVVADDGSYLRVLFPEGSHAGATWFFPTGTSDTVHLSYRLRLSPSWDASRSASNVKLPGFGQPRWDLFGDCAAACGGAPADGITGWSARGDLFENGVPGWYVYAPNGWGRGHRWNHPAYEPGRWYTVDLFVRMNRIGRADGKLVAKVDGQTVYERSNFVFRLLGWLHVNNVWFDFYYGGSGVPPTDMWIDIDDVVIEH